MKSKKFVALTFSLFMITTILLLNQCVNNYLIFKDKKQINDDISKNNQEYFYKTNYYNKINNEYNENKILKTDEFEEKELWTNQLQKLQEEIQ